GLWRNIFQVKWLLSGLSLLGLFFMLKLWYTEDEIQIWVEATWSFAKQITPLLLIGVFIAGLLLGRPGQEGLIPSRIVSTLVGGNSLGANFFASIVGAFMYFATLTEVPILQGLLNSGMGKGPALALLLAGPALSLPSMLVLRSIMGTKRTVVYVTIVVIISTICGIFFGNMVQ
ncbi:MAG: permease, partial [Candidatus Omnitrophica bacterium]|nr:permease [Candidatus Omnitrophota bacterium]